MEKKRQFKRGDFVRVSLPVGQIVEATVRAVIESSEGIKLDQATSRFRTRTNCVG
jgi:hypothetical protein